jgi:hypothetical protein
MNVMSRIRHASARGLVSGIAITGTVVTMLAAPAAATTRPASSICASGTNPGLAAHMSRGILAALNGRSSVVGLAAVDPEFHLTCNFHASRHFDAASVIKATIISALLLKVGGPVHLSAHQRHLAWLMITESDNDAATTLWDEVGRMHMQEFLNRAGMRHTVLNYAWGLTLLTAHDEMLLLRVLSNPGKVLSAKSRSYVLWLMAHVVAYERWGVSAGAPADVTVHLKNGWLPYPDGSDWHINSIGAFTGHGIGYQIVILTSGNAGESYGIQTVQAAAFVINKQLAGMRGDSARVPVLPGKASLVAPGG